MSREPPSEAERERAIRDARQAFLDGRLDLERFEVEVSLALAGDTDRCLYLSPFAPPPGIGRSVGIRETY